MGAYIRPYKVGDVVNVNLPDNFYASHIKKGMVIDISIGDCDSLILDSSSSLTLLVSHKYLALVPLPNLEEMVNI